MADGGGDGRLAPRLESGSGGFDGVGARLQLGEAEAAGIASADGARDAVVDAGEADRGAGQSGAGRVGYLACDGAGGFTLRKGGRWEKGGDGGQDD